MNLIDILNKVDAFIWGPPLLVLLVGTGILLTVKLGVVQITKLPRALKLIFAAENKGSGDVSSFAALCTALAATVGTGNIVGVATAIKAGGPGALFWMWIAAFFGMATKYSEGVLAIKYRTKDKNGQVSGGPMYYIVNGMGEKWRPLAIFFAISGILVALLGIGTFTQVNSITDAINSSFGVDPRITGVVLAVFVALVVFGGLKSISNVATKIVPFMAVIYIVICGVILISYWNKIPETFVLIIKSAFTPTAATGGFLGATMSLAIRNGIARGVFSNESGLGSAPIAAAAAKTEWPAEQGLISMTGTFIDTIIICTLTGFSLVISGVWCSDLNGAVMTQAAFNGAIPTFGPILLTVSLTLFAFTTILGWSYYGERCFEFLFGVKGMNGYRTVFVAMVLLGAFLKLEVVWIIADIVNGLMAIPNLIALLALSPIIVSETKKYFEYINSPENQLKRNA
ncbi:MULTISPECIES: alanine/glycine:cation symporter family protein [unclassified Clostridioides]|uniref:alanine/glycine:cation symporter family protein n=1 Tax=unclassified Clostridioides TaxID=2635829 RepID=UPI001D0C9F80|nr:sodium:alanine symporter family protein [Clostridioides sp. ES-S-0001-02]MCC0638994.1 sodium:alanine symporter family protein [Clostridioides sp. ES-S-0049-03]MCC0652743.1 sodium:alanine symporter family protein [Clostridioides sp. ES-S-0001-03]MCC0657279.1 sodium:alanine symporter family protein [Clostridioides sp. ES-S-0123-01]MCC0672683.1 sodium:alanine symporter family protein [Clostridioides sp. ES-S-0145-01]MCC0675384.1 sodium:alanine symporter family protein [Clostridioides sp. ES-W-